MGNVSVTVRTSLLLAVVALTTAAKADWAEIYIDDSLRGGDGVRTADANDDGWADFVVGYEESGRTRAYLHPGNAEDAATPSAWTIIDVGPSPDVEDAVFVDLDADGRLDVVSSCEGDTRQIRVHWAPEAYTDSSQWQTQTILSDNRAWMFCVPMQVDGLHGIDLVIAAKSRNGASPAEIGWLQAPANPRTGTWTYRTLSAAGWIMSLIRADIDADGDDDILLSDRYNNRGTRGVRWLENPGVAQVTSASLWTSRMIGGSDKENMFIDWADLNGDGDFEVAMVFRASRSNSRPGIRWFEPPEDPRTGTWQNHAITWPSGVGEAKAVRIVDINYDGLTDLVISCGEARNRTGIFYLSPTNGVTATTWAFTRISSNLGIKFDLCQLYDFNDDGWLDVITTEEQETSGGRTGGLGLVWYANPGGDDYLRWRHVHFHDQPGGVLGADAGEADDPDGDQESNRDEYRAGTNPLNADSVFGDQTLSFDPEAGLILSWNSAQDGTAPERSYQVLGAPSPGVTANWQPVSPVLPPMGDASDFTVPLPLADRYFFKVIIAEE